MNNAPEVVASIFVGYGFLMFFASFLPPTDS